MRDSVYEVESPWVGCSPVEYRRTYVSIAIYIDCGISRDFWWILEFWESLNLKQKFVKKMLENAIEIQRTYGNFSWMYVHLKSFVTT